MSGDVLHSDRVLHIESVALTLHPGLVDEDPSICCQASKCQGNVLVNAADFAHCP